MTPQPPSAAEMQKILAELERDWTKEYQGYDPKSFGYWRVGRLLQVVAYIRTLEKEQIDAKNALALAWSMILSGEKMSDTAEAMFQKVFPPTTTK